MKDGVTPKGATHYIDGSYYKIGLHGKAFMHNNIEWVASNKPASAIRSSPRLLIGEELNQAV